ncbi:uncharacterized protein A1O9_04739 [Exophiala aquamarina CBS 119918]|uniref:Uncharacterized protein n=1 Tax=Exophiala aquamarina CBS 119918 TaxID=1182545 RepID=A0A072PJ37_9EURO|nr:uncharacterized protein A1O9_04739 [Exophiala aquamarina CBS 119918]KEF59891.1 hypothetical protein A1O9_04739 [Exophiala aquamarina CBS 119918]
MPITNPSSKIRKCLEENPVQRILVKRMGAAEEIANVDAFPAGNEVDFVTAASWSVDRSFGTGC